MSRNRRLRVPEVLDLVFNVPGDGCESDDPDFEDDDDDSDSDYNNHDQGDIPILDSESESESETESDDEQAMEPPAPKRATRGRGRSRARGRGRSQTRPTQPADTSAVPNGLDQQRDVSYPEFAPGAGYLPGPTVLMDPSATPMDYWHLLVPEEFLDTIVQETNNYAKQKKYKHWNDTTVGEIKCFFGIVMALGIHRLSNLRDLWSEDWVIGVPAIAKCMPKNRFVALMGNVHLVDNPAYLYKYIYNATLYFRCNCFEYD